MFAGKLAARVSPMKRRGKWMRQKAICAVAVLAIVFGIGCPT